MKLSYFALILVTVFSSLSFAIDDMNSLIESASQEGKKAQKTVSRAVSSDKSFSAEVVSVKRERAYNPVTYNPFVDDDEVIVKSIHDEK